MFSFSNSIIYSQDKNENVFISKIKISGSEIISKNEIKKNIATNFPSIFPWKKKPLFDEEIFNDDIKRIKALYHNKGFYDVEIDHYFKYRDNYVEIFVIIEQGAPVITREIKLEINNTLLENEKDKILKELPLKEDEYFSSEKYQESKNFIKRYFSNIGYPKVSVKGEALVNKREKWAHVIIKIDTGDIYHFGKILVDGNKSVKKKIIEREILYKTDKQFSYDDIDKTRLKIFRLGFFKSVVIDIIFNDTLRIVDTLIRVEEKKFGSIKAGIGFGTEDLLRGQLIWDQRNIFGGGRKLEVAGKYSDLTQRLSAKFTQPYFLDKDSKFISTVLLNRDDLPSYTSENLSFTNKVEKKYTNYRVSLSHTLQYSDVSDLSSATKEFINKEDYFLSYLYVDIEKNTTTDIFNPKKGSIISLSLEASFSFLGSDEDYLKNIFEFKHYRKLFDDVVFAKRFLVGVIQPLGNTETLDVPIFKRFFAGGSTTMRGFPYLELGPLDDNDDPVGGNSIILGSLELRFPIYKKLGGVAFLDYGNVFPEEYDFKIDDIKYAVGTGLRVDTIVGPLRIDLGYTLNPEPNIDRFQFFLSVGHAF